MNEVNVHVTKVIHNFLHPTHRILQSVEIRYNNKTGEFYL